MAKARYLMNLYFHTPGQSEPVFKGVRPIDAPDDAEAIREALGDGSWDKPAYFILRAVTPTDERIVYTSRRRPA